MTERAIDLPRRDAENVDAHHAAAAMRAEEPVRGGQAPPTDAEVKRQHVVHAGRGASLGQARPRDFTGSAQVEVFGRE